jgi:amino acid adenylation domain-containing protein
MNHLLWQRVRARAMATPDRPAVRGDSRTLSYGELWQASGRVAAFLQAHQIGRGDRVGLLLPKSPECVVSMLGILRSGAAYVPVDPRAPASRQAYVLADAAVAAVISTPSLLGGIGAHHGAWSPRAAVVHGPGDVPAWLGGCSTGTLGALDDSASVSDGGGTHEGDPAYLLYTSGSTGQPKGVVISHRNAITFVDWGIESFDVTETDVLANHAPHHFDLSVFDIYVALHAGATVAIVPDRLSPFPSRLAEWIEHEGITIWYSVPTALVRLLLQGQLERFTYSRLRAVLFAGEPFPLKYLRDVMERFPCAEFHNLFGPTETNVCTWYRVPRPVPDEVRDLPIGHVCANQAAVVLREDGQAAGVGEEGELLIGGANVMLGYWQLPERTASVRVQNPLHEAYADPVHRTGDHVRVQPDGSFHFLGRRDHMVKTRGYRVELGEVESAILSYPSARMAAVVALPDDEIGNRLCAAIALDAGASTTHEALVCFLLERLPRYAVPERTLFVDELPLTSTGKLDRTGIRDRILASSLTL